MDIDSGYSTILLHKHPSPFRPPQAEHALVS